MNVDLSQFDGISDRVARAKAKSEAVRKANIDGGGSGGPAPTTTATTADAGAAAASEEARESMPVLDFRPGIHFKWRDRAARIVSIRYDLVSFVYDDDPDQVVTADRYRLSHAHHEGDLVFAPRAGAYRPERFAEYGRIGYHDYLWLESRSGMTEKKRRPKIIAIINPDYCTGCNACIEVCPTDCIEEVDVSEAGLDGIGKFCEVRLSDCIGCVQCVKICPWEAIDMIDTDRVEEAYGLPANSL